MKQPKQHPRNKTLILVLLVLGCAAMLATGTYAAYTSSASVKRVVVARTHEAADQLRFSSNYLLKYSQGESQYVIRPISVSSSGEAKIPITVCNYPQNDPASYNDTTFTYTVTITAPEGVSIEPQNGTLKGGQMSSKLHMLSIPAASLSAVSSGVITVVVTPDSTCASAVENCILAAHLKVMPTAAEASAWQCELIFDEPLENNDAINLHIYGTKECDMVLSWGDKVELGRWSKELLTVTGSTGNSLTIHVGGPDQPTSYYLQFYRTQPAAAGEPLESLGISFNPPLTSEP